MFGDLGAFFLTTGLAQPLTLYKACNAVFDSKNRFCECFDVGARVYPQGTEGCMSAVQPGSCSNLVAMKQPNHCNVVDTQIIISRW